MKFARVVQFHQMLKKRLGDDLTYSLVLDNDHTISLYVSAHASKTRENTDKMIRCVFNEKDLNKEVLTLVNEIAIMYDGQFMPRKQNVIERTVTADQQISDESV